MADHGGIKRGHIVSLVKMNRSEAAGHSNGIRGEKHLLRALPLFLS